MSEEKKEKIILFCHSLRRGQRDIQSQAGKSKPYRQHEENHQQDNTGHFRLYQSTLDQKVFHRFSVVQS
jgi:hypothetical protein